MLAAVIDSVAPLHVARGSRTGVRTAADFSINIGFKPKYVKVVNLTDRVTGEWFDNDGGNAFQLITVALGTRTYVANNISVANTTFSVVVATSGLETDNDVVYWEAYG